MRPISLDSPVMHRVGVRPFAARFHGGPFLDNSAGAVRVTVTMQSTVETYRSIIPKLIFISRVAGRWRAFIAASLRIALLSRAPPLSLSLSRVL